ncbi:MAG: iron-only hydrogenase system regulator [Ruminococcus sp.]|nr:iron-only hydrogenase system regulator [Ruminococcus sp.]
MEKRIAVMSIIVENNDSTEKLNLVLHQAGEYIIGRMGIPYREKHISVISVVIDAPQDIISALCGKIGNIDGVTVKTAYSNVISNE